LGVGIRLQCSDGSPEFETEARERTAGSVPKESGAVSVLTGETCVEKLAQLFPNVSPMRIPVRITRSGPAGRRLQEQTVIEFGTAQEVIFSSSLPLEFEDRVQLLNSDRSLDARATVVAVRYHEGRKAIAARFLGEVGNWIIKP
jgi:hypothetical protein